MNCKILDLPGQNFLKLGGVCVNFRPIFGTKMDFWETVPGQNLRHFRGLVGGRVPVMPAGRKEDAEQLPFSSSSLLLSSLELSDTKVYEP